ncbi:MAG TPA: hypothetical protein VMR21_13315 [Vicinamibacteria bacterium]|nr:hypothetical protein [Vicinamibacteria bacterium]
MIPSAAVASVFAWAVLAAAPPPFAAAPCAACVTWRGDPATAARLLEGPGALHGLDVLMTTAGDPSSTRARDVARALAARGAVVGIELPLDGAHDPGLLQSARRVVLRLPADARVGEDLVFRIRTRATSLRSAAPELVVGLAGPGALLRALARRGIAPYVSVLVDSSGDPSEDGGEGDFEWWRPARTSTVADLLAETSRAPGGRLVATLGGADAEVARRLARLSDLLPRDLTELPDVSLCAEGGEDCARPVLLHPRTLEAIAVVGSPALLRVRPGATRAVARPLADGTDHTLEVVSIGGETVVDARRVPGPFVLRLAGWAGGEAGFTAGVEVEAARSLTVAEILAAHQVAAARQSARLRTLIASGHTVLVFQVPGLAAPMTLTAKTVLYRQGTLTEIEQRDLRLNGVPVAVGRDGVPRLPLVQPERVAAAPLSITLGEQYRYRLVGEEAAAGRRCYVVAFDPVHRDRPSFEGRAWIAKDTFALVRLRATQTNLRGAIVSSRQEDQMRPLAVEGREVWLPARSEVDQVYEGPAHRTPLRREVVFERVEANPADFEARLAAARTSRSVMMRETEDGFRYLRRIATAAAGAEEGPRPPGLPREGAAASGDAARALAGSASRVWSVAAGTLFDPNIDRPLPFAGLGYLDFDVLGTGAQASAFLAGPFVQAAVAVPSLGRPGLQLHASVFASLVRYNDRAYRGGRERYDENLHQRPLRASVAVLRRLGGRARLRAAYDVEATRLEPNDTTAEDFRAPVDPVAHGLRLGLEWEGGAWSASAWASASRRQRWREWGRPGDYSSAARTYQRAGLSLTRSVVLSPRAVARVEAGALAGRHLDRFSRFAFDAFENRLRGYPSAGVRFDRALLVRAASTWTAARGLRLDGFADAALVRDPTAAAGVQRHLGVGAAVEAALPGRILLTVDWGFGLDARDREGRRGTHVVRITAFKIL